MKRFDWKIYLGLAIAVAALLPPSLYASLALFKVVSNQRDLVTVSARKLFLAERLRYLKERQFSIMPAFVIQGDYRLLIDFYQAHDQFLSLLRELETYSSAAKHAELLQRIGSIDRSLYAAAQPAIRRRLSGESIVLVDQYLTVMAGPLSSEFAKALDRFVSYEREEFHRVQEENQYTTNNIIRGFLIACLLAVGFALVAITMTIGVVRRKRAEDRQIALDLDRQTDLSRARKETVEVVSHDLKNPLSTAKMSLDLLTGSLSGQSHDPKVREGLEITARSIRAMETLVSDLLDHSKIEAGKLVLDHRPCLISYFINDLISRFEIIAQKKEIEIRKIGTHDLPVIHCDQNRVEQVLSNILGNAIKFSPPGSTIEVRGELAVDSIVIAVRDQGPGMSTEQLSHIFERYWHVRENAQRGSNGLGLSIAKAIVDAHGGEIWATSEMGKGSEVLFSLPLKEARLAGNADRYSVVL